MKKEQITIAIPKGKVPVMEQIENKVVITWKEKKCTYDEIFEHLRKNKKVIYYITNNERDKINDLFLLKVNAIRKLTNIRNYFGRPDGNTRGWIIEQGEIRRTSLESKHYFNIIVFAQREHAQAAIDMLGDEVKYIFEPW